MGNNPVGEKVNTPG